MTLKQLIKKLQKIDKQNPNKRIKVCAAAMEMLGERNHCFSHVNITDVKIDYIENADGDGWGTGNYSFVVVLQ